MKHLQENSWRRLTRAEATNYLITSLILRGMDPKQELVIDGDPGPFLERAARELDIDWSTIDSNTTIEGWRIFGAIALIDLAEKIGYEGTTIRGIIDYLRSLPTIGPIGRKRKR